MKEEVISVGIDIGTTTTQLILSKLIVENTATIFSIPQVKIISKEIFYKSKIYFTPLLSPTEIDANEIKKIIQEEYKIAGIDPKDVKTGAIIVTGETARKNNADSLISRLSEYAGEFVVATAGPELEAILAGRGSGAEKFSRENKCCIANIDIGGGTSNIVVFKNGEVIDVCALDIGGRLIKFKENTLVPIYISPKIKQLSKTIGLEIEVNKLIDFNDLIKITKRMSEIIEEILCVRPKTEILNNMLITRSLKMQYGIDYITFSGGVADYIYSNNKDYFKFNDIGILLGEAISKSEISKVFKVFKPQETIRATVIGAGVHTVEISGSTITYTKDILPIKNIPVIKLDDNLSENSNLLSKRIKEKIEWYFKGDNFQNLAISFKGKSNPSFTDINLYADQIIDGLKTIIEKQCPIIVILENDFAKALGQCIYKKINKKVEVICIDGIEVSNGDYVDIGRPLSSGRVLPVAIKTLIFK